MSACIPVRFALDNLRGFGSSSSIAGWVFAPRLIDPTRVQPVAFCIHGGGYDKRYFHIEPAGCDDYSMCRYFAERGAIAVTIDCLDTAESSRAEQAEFVTVRTLSEANHGATRDLAERLRRGTLTPQIPALPRFELTGIGHSLGGLLLTVQQATHRSFGRVAILGWSNLGLERDPAALKPIFDPTGDYVYASSELRRSFHLADVPDFVLASAAEREASPISLTLATEAADREAIRRAASSIAAPVFVGYGEDDTSPSPHAETACYESAADITFFRLAGSGHCHNFATTRVLLWDRLLRWMAGTPISIA